MKKIVLVINGAGGVGKDTLCSFVAEQYDTINISAVDPVKKAATILGWDGNKKNNSRKFLSDLKQLSIQYNDFPTQYLLNQYNIFINSDAQVLFVHIREKDEIAHFIESVSGQVKTLLIRKTNLIREYGNYSDDNVEDYDYDFIYRNDLPLEDAKKDFLKFFEKYVVPSFLEDD